MCGGGRRRLLAGRAARFAATARSSFAKSHRRMRWSIPNRSRRSAKALVSFFTKPVAKPAHGFDYVAGFAEFFAKTTHMGIYRARVDHALVAPDIVEQTIARLDATASLHQRAQKLEFDAGEIHPFAA